MRGRIKKKWAWFGGTALAVVVVAAVMVVPALGTPQVMELAPTSPGSASLTFTHPSAGSQLVANGDKGCEIGSPLGPLVDITASTTKGPGIVSGAIGVKSGGSNGTPCSLTEFKPKESLTLTSKVGAWTELRLDTENKDNAHVKITLHGGTAGGEVHQLLTGASITNYVGTFRAASMAFPYGATTGPPTAQELADGINSHVAACANPSDSGPDSGANDNCRWTIIADGSFTGFTIETLEGAISLEGGGDDPSNLSPSEFVYAEYVAFDDDTLKTDEDTPKSFNVLLNDEGVDPAAVVSFFGTDDEWLNADGTPATPSWFSQTGTSGVFVFDPTGIEEFNALRAGVSTEKSFAYSTVGSSGSGGADVKVTVTGVNDAPEPLPGGATISTTEPDGPDPVVSPATPIAKDVDDGDFLSLTSCQSDDSPSPAWLSTASGDPEAVAIKAYDAIEDAYFEVGYLRAATLDEIALISDPDPNQFYVVFVSTDLNYNTASLTFYCEVEDGQGAGPLQPITVDLVVSPTNDDPVANPDSGAGVDRESAGDGGPFGIASTTVVDVIANDTDVDLPPDTLTVTAVDLDAADAWLLDASDSQVASYTGARGTAVPDGSNIQYTTPIGPLGPNAENYDPDDGIEWPDTDPSNPDYFGVLFEGIEYTVSDGKGGTATGTVDLLIRRVICSEESVTDSAGYVSGTFENVSPFTCKWYKVIAQEGATPLQDTVEFVTPGDGDPASTADDVYFLAELTFSPEGLVLSAPDVLSETIGMQVDLDGSSGPDGFTYMPLCVGDYLTLSNPTELDPADPTAPFPDPSVDRWCWYRMEGIATGGGLYYRYFIYGSIDPTFKRL